MNIVSFPYSSRPGKGMTYRLIYNKPCVVDEVTHIYLFAVITVIGDYDKKLIYQDVNRLQCTSYSVHQDTGFSFVSILGEGVQHIDNVDVSHVWPEFKAVVDHLFWDSTFKDFLQKCIIKDSPLSCLNLVSVVVQFCIDIQCVP